MNSCAVCILTQVDYGLFDCHVQVVLPWQPLSYYWSCPDQSDFLLEASVKLILNAVSTGAHVLRGKVLGNRMADLKVRYGGCQVALFSIAVYLLGKGLFCLKG